MTHKNSEVLGQKEKVDVPARLAPHPIHSMALDTFFPEKRTNRMRKDSPWITAEIRHKMQRLYSSITTFVRENLPHGLFEQLLVLLRKSMSNTLQN